MFQRKEEKELALYGGALQHASNPELEPGDPGSDGGGEDELQTTEPVSGKLLIFHCISSKNLTDKTSIFLVFAESDVLLILQIQRRTRMTTQQ